MQRSKCNFLIAIKEL
jgi:large subunit ribosomal protein L34